MAFLKVWVHMVWTTKNRMPYLKRSVRSSVFRHICENARSKGIFVDSIGGGQEHIHLLISLGAEERIAEIAQLLKSESSFWINKQDLIQGKFEWQDDYYVVSVGENELPHIRIYILNQDEHHRKKSFSEEYQNFIATGVGA